MRFLFCATPGPGHVEPMVPLLSTLIHRGHHVAWAGAAETHARMHALGVQQCYEVGAGAAAAHAEYQRRWPGAASPEGTHPTDPQAFARLFGGVHAPQMLSPLVQAIERWAPQLVVSETGVIAAPLACDLNACMQVTHGLGLPPTDELLQDAADAFAPSWLATTGRPPPVAGGLLRNLYLDICPATLQPPELVRKQRCQRLRPLRVRQASQVPMPSAVSDRLGGFKGWPFIYLSFGTLVNDVQALRTAALALSRMRARVVITTGDEGDPKLFHRVPANVHIERNIPQADLLPHCALAVSHGGSGTSLAASAHGLPQLVLPQGADPFTTAMAVQASGTGLVLRGDEATAERIQATAQTLLEQPSYRAQAKRVANEIAAMPSADEAAARLENLVSARHYA